MEDVGNPAGFSLLIGSSIGKSMDFFFQTRAPSTGGGVWIKTGMVHIKKKILDVNN